MMRIFKFLLDIAEFKLQEVIESFVRNDCTSVKSKHQNFISEVFI
jgi:hypothetical protein